MRRRRLQPELQAYRWASAQQRPKLLKYTVEMLLRRLLLLCILLQSMLLGAQQSSPIGQGWPAYGGDAGGSRYSSANQINRSNLAHLHIAWTFHTHSLDKARTGLEDASFENTPVLLDRVLYISSPFDEVFALDATTGAELWHHDPDVHPVRDGMIVTSRGVALWPATASTQDAAHTCGTRVFIATIDARLLALDAATGRTCSDFGASGEVNLRDGVHYTGAGGYGVTSAPTVIGDVVVVGSTVADNQQVDSESGVVRGFDVHNGHLLWSWDPIPWAESQHPRTGAGNAWSTISADPALGLIYVPTGSASPDFYGGLRLGDDRDADSVVALDARTGRKVWAFQTVHHNLWDYDVAAQPLLFLFRQSTPAVAIATKSGQVFVLDRRTGVPLFPVEERPVPQTSVPGEITSPTQPISSLPSLAPLSFSLQSESGWQRSDANLKSCRDQLASLRYEGMYTPPSLGGTLLYPGSLGGVNWGSLAFDPASGMLYANNNRVPFAIKLIDRSALSTRWQQDFEPVLRDWPIWILLSVITLGLFCIFRRRWTPGLQGLFAAMAVASIAGVVCLFPIQYGNPHFGVELSPQRGSPYLIKRSPLVDHDGDPCIAPPWGAVTALNLNTGRIAWQTTLGTNHAHLPTGGLSLGGPMVTAGGVLFAGATLDARLRAFDSATGTELWSAPLPAAAQATPMTYTLDGRQFVVIAAGGHAGLDHPRGDSLVAFALDAR
jgi:quinoprotein glucose dehydrogenase